MTAKTARTILKIQRFSKTYEDAKRTLGDTRECHNSKIKNEKDPGQGTSQISSDLASHKA
eukprot:scaffold32245_cov106-Cyclotella_meneghiniana.AAC.1